MIDDLQLTGLITQNLADQIAGYPDARVTVNIQSWVATTFAGPGDQHHPCGSQDVGSDLCWDATPLEGFDATGQLFATISNLPAGGLTIVGVVDSGDVSQGTENYYLTSWETQEGPVFFQHDAYLEAAYFERTYDLIARLAVGIDIKPRSFPNSIDSGSRGRTPVAILSTATFNAPAQVDRTTLTFGRTGTEASLSSCGTKLEDVNGDGRLDLVCHFTTGLTGFQPGDTQGTLKGLTLGGIPFIGTDSVRINQ